MNKQEFKDLNKAFIDVLGKELVKEDAELHVLPSTPFDKGMKIAINFKGVRMCDVYSLENTGDYAQWSYEGKMQF